MFIGLVKTHVRKKMVKEVIYVLLLQGNNYYVGRTNNVDRRFKQHESGKCGSVWTAKHKPVRVYNTEPLIHPYQELTTTLTMMKEHGIERVRGDVFTSEHLSDVQMTQIKMSIASEDGLCYVCMEKGHVAQYCPNRDIIKVTNNKTSKQVGKEFIKNANSKLVQKTEKSKLSSPKSPRSPSNSSKVSNTHGNKTVAQTTKTPTKHTKTPTKHTKTTNKNQSCVIM